MPIRTYVVVDIEANGPVPGLYSMLSIGAVAVTDLRITSEFTVNLKPLPNAREHPKTMNFWNDNIEAYKAITQDQVDPKEAMERFVEWLNGFEDEKAFVSHGTPLDAGYLDWYSFAFLGHNPFNYDSYNVTQASRLDLPSFIAGIHKLPISNAHNGSGNEALYPMTVKHTHVPVDDARGYAEVLIHYLSTHGVENNEIARRFHKKEEIAER